MATSVVIDSVTTADAAPTVAPHRISQKAGKSTATIVFTIDATDLTQARAIRAYRIRRGSVDYKTGTLIRRFGRIQPGAGLKCGVGARISAYAGRPPETYTEPISYADAGGGADGDRSIQVYALTTQGWST